MNLALIGKNLRETIEKALGAVVSKYKMKASKFEMDLLSLQQNRSIGIFFNSLYDKINDLNITRETLEDVLTHLGSDMNFKQSFGMTFYELWFQFFLISQGNFNTRIDKDLIYEFPREKRKQLEALKSICLANKQNKVLNEQEQLLTALEDTPLFKQFLDTKEKLSNQSPIKSKIKEMSSIQKSQLKNIQSEKLSIVFNTVLESIGKTIGIVQKINNLNERRESLKDYINEKINSPQKIENQVITVNLKEILLNILGIEIRKNDCRLLEQTQEVIKAAFQMWNTFYTLQDAVIKCDTLKLSYEELFDYCSKLLYTLAFNKYLINNHMQIFFYSSIKQYMSIIFDCEHFQCEHFQ